VPGRFRGLVPRPRVFVPIAFLAVVVLAACDKKEPTGVKLCVDPPRAYFTPDKAQVNLGSDGFQVAFSVVDCRNVPIEDEYTWGTTDTTIIEVTPDGSITAVGIGTAYATVTGRDNGLVGMFKVTVGGSDRTPPPVAAREPGS
jgi:hypothetical protein